MDVKDKVNRWVIKHNEVLWAISCFIFSLGIGLIMASTVLNYLSIAFFNNSTANALINASNIII